MPARGSAIAASGVEHRFDIDAELMRLFGAGVRPLHFERALFEAMLDGWAPQQRSRMLSRETIVNRRRLVCRLHEHAGAWPWEWHAEHLEEWIEDLALAPRRLHVSTLRNYQIAIRLFCDYVLDRRYPWTAICAERLGAWAQQIVDERNLISHVGEFEADPRRRPLSRGLVAFFDFCDAQVAGERGGELYGRCQPMIEPVFGHTQTQSQHGRLPPTRPRRGPDRMAAHHRHPQPPQASPTRSRDRLTAPRRSPPSQPQPGPDHPRRSQLTGGLTRQPRVVATAGA